MAILRTRPHRQWAAWSQPLSSMGSPLPRRLGLDPGLRFVVIVPARELETNQARAALARMVPHEDAVFNLGRLGLLVAGLADRRQLLATAGDDRLHQGARSVLFPEAPALLEGLRQAGALTSCWSGAGRACSGFAMSATLLVWPRRPWR